MGRIYLSKEFEHIQWYSYFSDLTILNLVGLLLWIDFNVISFSFHQTWMIFFFSNKFHIFYAKIKLNKIIGYTFSNWKVLDETSLVLRWTKNRIIS